MGFGLGRPENGKNDGAMGAVRGRVQGGNATGDAGGAIWCGADYWLLVLAAWHAG